MKTLSKLLDEALNIKRPELVAAITSVTSSSARCTTGTLFVAMKGATARSCDGHNFINEAIHNGAVAAIVDENYRPAKPFSIPLIAVSNSRRALSFLAEAFYDNPSKKLCVIGITGTNGKTSTTFMLHSILKKAGHAPKLLGTLGAGDPDALTPLTHTTVDPEFLSARLAQFVDEGASHVLMEVSSHALSLARVEAIHFHATALTNITQDHLDFHHSLDNYREAKARLFFALAPHAKIVLPNDHPFGTRTAELGHLSFYDPSASPSLSLPFYGGFHQKNARLAQALAHALGIDAHTIDEGLSECPPIPGRLEAIPHDHGFFVFVDFAHTPHALEDLLTTVRGLAHGKLIVVFGCGGDREREKRPMMGHIAAQHADVVIITDDNPRTEEPSDIRAQILAGVVNSSHEVHEIAERKQALKFALTRAQKNDIVVIAGKGHESSQTYGQHVAHFSDQEEAKKILETL